VDSQIAQPKIFVKQIAGVAVAAAVLLLAFLLGTTYLQSSSSPYIQSVFDRQGDIARGQQIFRINCAGCHGIQADGLVGPSLHSISRRRSSASLIHQVIDGETPPMPKFQPTSQEMADLLNYLETL
jgi:mono/diheme cytochrome c family protein